VRIGEIAERVGVNPKTIRFYESIGVIPEPPRTPGGYRDYEQEHVERLQFVRAAQRLGLKLEDIAEVLAFRDRGERPCDFVMGVVRREVELLGSRIREMRRLKGELEGLLERAEELRETEGEKFCPLIPAHAFPTES
jgi:DNA-binding transcriptional MerR regulator